MLSHCRFTLLITEEWTCKRLRSESAQRTFLRKWLQCAEWLDERRCDPSNFTFRRSGSIISIYVAFGKDADGEAFKARFPSQT